MAVFYGNIQCTKCHTYTRALVEKEEMDKEFYLLGDEYKTGKDEETIKGMTTCDQCNHVFRTFVRVKNNIVSAFLTKENEKKEVEQVEKGLGLIKEKNKDLFQFQIMLVCPFKEQPFEVGKEFEIKGKKWIIQKVYKKESIEEEISTRLLDPFYDQYWYEMKDENQKEKKWLIVTDVGENNAIFTQDPPVVKENETAFDITEHPVKTELCFEDYITQKYHAKGYQMISGVRLMVYNTTNEIEMDVFDETLEKAIEQARDEIKNGITL